MKKKVRMFFMWLCYALWMIMMIPSLIPFGVGKWLDKEEILNKWFNNKTNDYE